MDPPWICRGATRTRSCQPGPAPESNTAAQVWAPEETGQAWLLLQLFSQRSPPHPCRADGCGLGPPRQGRQKLEGKREVQQGWNWVFAKSALLGSEKVIPTTVMWCPPPREAESLFLQHRPRSICCAAPRSSTSSLCGMCECCHRLGHTHRLKRQRPHDGPASNRGASTVARGMRAWGNWMKQHQFGGEAVSAQHAQGTISQSENMV